MKELGPVETAFEQVIPLGLNEATIALGVALDSWSAIIGWAGPKIAGTANVKGLGEGEHSAK